MIIYWDIETYSQCSLKERGAHVYANDSTTGIHFFCWAMDDGEVQTWRPDDPAPAPFTNPTRYTWVSDNWEFDRAIHAHILVKRYGFPPIPIANQDCAQRRALAHAFPAELGLRCEALGLPYRKDPEARRAMLRLSRPQTAKKRKKPEDPAARERDLALLWARCMRDVAATRAAYTSSRLQPLLPEERAQLLLDAEINGRGIGANIPFLEAMRTLAVRERNAVNARLNELSVGVITSVDQVARIKDAVNARGHAMTSLTKRSVSATLAHNPDETVRELLTLRQRGAYASVRMAKRLLGYADPTDSRIRGWGRIYGAGPGRWSSPGPQLHNLKRNDAEYPASLVEALIVGDYAELARWGNPLAVAAELSRAALCAKPGHILICADLGAIESRIPAWFAGEEWKLATFREYDRTGDERLHPYRQTAARMLQKDVLAITKAERQLGKCAELASGFGGSVGAWRRIAHDEDVRSDAEVLAFIKQWRDAHPAIRAFWKELAQAARVAIRTGRPILVAAAPRPPITATFDGYALTLTLPSGRAITYPGARLSPNTKFEDGNPDIEFFDNARGQWKPARAWFGTLTENVVQGCARDLLAAALLRFEARGLPVVFHCHDEVVVEVPEGSISEQEVLAILLEPPVWAANLPLGGKVHSGRLYLEAPATGEPPTGAKVGELGAESAEIDHEIDRAVGEIDDEIDRAIDDFVAGAEPLPATKEVERGAEEDFLASLGETIAPLTDFVSLPMDAGGRVSCPFHEDWEPSCRIYADHFHCYGCGERGGRMDWLTRAEGMTKAEAIAALQDWSGPVTTPEQDVAARTMLAKDIWFAAQPLVGTIGERYLAETRGIDISKLPPTIHNALRFHPRCVFGARAVHPCIVALMRDPITAVPIGIHRIGLAIENGAVIKLDRMALGRMGVVMLWPMNGGGRLVVGEGIETTLAAATRISYQGAPLTPAWSAVARGALGRFPPLRGVERLILLVDHDENGEGQRAAGLCRRIWRSAGRTAVPLIPKQRGWDFNDVVLGRKV
jgi:DNA polymerase